MTENSSKTVTSAEFVRHFARYRDKASRGPVFISHHGRETHVLCSVTDFDTPPGTGEANADTRHPDDFRMAYGLADWIDEALIICNEQLDILFVNRDALAIVHKSKEQLIDRPLLDALPEIAGSLMEIHTQHTILGGEPSSGDLPSPFKQDAWLQFSSFPLDHRIVLKFRDITEEVLRHRLADVNAVIKQAMSAHGGVGYVRLSVRGTIDRIEEPVCNMLGLPAERLLGVALGDLVTVQDRATFREKQEEVLRGNGPAVLTCQFLANTGELLHVKLAMVRLRGAYGAEGAIVLLTPACPEE